MSDNLAAIGVQHLKVSYAGSAVIDDFTLAVKPGEFFSLVGVNGAGKSTFIKSLLDFIDIDAGELSIFGAAHDNTRAREALAFLPERFVPPYYLTGAEFLDYMLSLHGCQPDPKAMEAMAIALDLRVTALRESVRHYSKGMTQKLGLAACFLSGKKLIILDEPMSGLDPKARVLVKRQLLALKEKGVTVFFSSHLLADVGELADRMAVLHEGRLSFIGTPKQCMAHHQTDSLETAFIRCIESEHTLLS